MSARAVFTLRLPELREIWGIDHFQCNIHPWMMGSVWTFDHPYAAVTDANGRFAISNPPAGKWRLVVWHEKVGYRDWKAPRFGELVTVKGDARDEFHVGPIEFESDNWAEQK